MSQPADVHALNWTPSVYYAEILVNCTLDRAWQHLLTYETWNPGFIGPTVIPVSGGYRQEGEIVLIKNNVVDSGAQPSSDLSRRGPRGVSQR